MNTRMMRDPLRAVSFITSISVSCCAFSVNVSAENIYQLESVQQQFDCESMAMELLNSLEGEQSMRAVFGNEMLTMILSDSTQVIKKKQCEIDFGLHINPGYRLTSIGFSFNVQYNLSPMSTARAKTQLRINSSNNVYTTQLDLIGTGEPSFGRFSNLSVSNGDNNINSACGEGVFIEVSAFLEVISPPSDTVWSKITLDQGILELDKLVFETC
jgi:hypothetical protein